MWAILFSHPADYTPVCTTELSMAVKMKPEFDKRNVKMMALSIDSVEDHLGWCKDIAAYSGAGDAGPSVPIIADKDRKMAVQLGMLDPAELDKSGKPMTARTVFIIGPDKKLKLSMLYPATTGRNFDEILRVIDSLQLTATQKVATPVNWKSGERCMVPPNVPADSITKGIETVDLPSGKGYMRFTPQP